MDEKPNPYQAPIEGQRLGRRLSLIRRIASLLLIVLSIMAAAGSVIWAMVALGVLKSSPEIKQEARIIAGVIGLIGCGLFCGAVLIRR